MKKKEGGRKMLQLINIRLHQSQPTTIVSPTPVVGRVFVCSAERKRAIIK